MCLYRRPALTAAAVGLSTLREAGASVLTAAGAGVELFAGRAFGTHDALVQRFAAAVRDGTPPPVTAREGREAVRVLAMLVGELERQTPLPAPPARLDPCAESAAS